MAQDLSTKWAGAPGIFHIPEYYNWTSKGGVRDFVTSNGIPEKINADPYGEGWLVKVKLSDTSEVDSLLDVEAYEQLLED